jgi:hypothetical protein
LIAGEGFEAPSFPGLGTARGHRLFEMNEAWLPGHYWAVSLAVCASSEENCRSRDSSKKIDLKIFLILDVV